MTFVGIVGLLLALASAYVARPWESREKSVVFVTLFLLHTAASIAYYYVALSIGADAIMYFDDPYGIYGNYWGLGTLFVVHLVQYMRELIGGTMLDHFMLFQAIGFWGIIFMAKTFDEIFQELDVSRPVYIFLVLFLPGLHFWTGAIGKDAPLFLGVALSVWAMMRIGKRFPVFALAVAIMMLFRPHIALLALGSLTLAILIDARTRLWIKGAILGVIFLGLGSVVAGVEATFMLDLSSAESMADFLTRNVSVESGADAAIVEGGFMVKLVSLLFRPFFIDAQDMMGYVASAENLVLALIFGYLVWNIGLVSKLFMKVMYLRFSVIFFVALTILLALVNFNVGLGLRQKMMVMPCVLALFVSIVAVKLVRRQAGQLVPVQGYHPAAAQLVQTVR